MSTKNFLSEAEFMRTLPKKRMAAGALIRDADGRMLIVKPTYRPDWLVPGGAIEADESPHAACKREVAEELGLDLAIGRLLALDYQPVDGGKTEALMFAFDGGTVSAGQVGQIRLAADELSEYRFAHPHEALGLLAPKLLARMTRALDALANGTTLYAEDNGVIT